MTEQLSEIWQLRVREPVAALGCSRAILAASAAQLTAADKVRLHTTVAVTCAALGRFDEAMTATSSVEALPGDERDWDSEIDFELRRVRGRSALLGKRQPEALKLALINLDRIAESGDERLLALAHSDAASAFGIGGNLRKALAHLQESLQRTPESSNREYGTLLNNLGNVYMSLDRIEEAAACFVGARLAFRKIDYGMQIGLTLSNEGRAVARLGQLERAIELQTAALGMFESGGFGHLVVATLYKLAESLAEHGDAEQAEQTFRRALARSAEDDAGGYEDEARAAYGEFLFARERPAEAGEQFIRAVELVTDCGSDRKIAHLLERAATAQQAAGDIDAALRTSRELLQLRDRTDLAPAQPGIQTQLVELELALEREAELMQATGSALVEANRRLARKSGKLSELAMTDYLTGLHNRRHFVVKLDAAVSGSRSNGGDFSVIFIDVDNFKAINDSWGHETGDLVLQQLAQLFMGVVRESDVVARWGGEEFAILLPRADSRAAHVVADKIRQAVAGYGWARYGTDLRVTISAGLISSADHPRARADDVMRIADSLLYQAKSTGRNRTIRSVTTLPGDAGS